MTTAADLLLDRARRAGVLIATAESCTGGLLSGAITAIAGSSEIFDRGFVTYSNPAKQKMLGVRAETLAAYGAVSPQVAEEMALGALIASEAGLSVSVTGIAGPGGSDHKPEGRVCFGLARRGDQGAQIVRSETVEFGTLGRDAVREASVSFALDLLLGELS